MYSGIFRDGGAGAQATLRFRKRRKRLMDAEKKLMVLSGVPYGPGQETVWAYTHSPTYQEPAIMYLTGVNQPRVILLLDPHSRNSREILFLDSKDPSKEFWDGIRLGVGNSKSVREAQQVTGIREIRHLDEFESVLKERLSKRKNKKLGALWMEGKRNGRQVIHKADHNWSFRNRLSGLLRKWKIPQKALCNIMENHFDLRMPLDKYDVANTRKANLITGKAFQSTLRHFPHFNNESQVQGFLEGRMMMDSPFGLSFPSIVASGPNATTLHYMKNDDSFSKNELVLIDFGVRWMTMHADISRTVPASGKFNPMQKMLYEIVLKAQLAVQRAAKKGVTIKELNDVCWRRIDHELKNTFCAAGGKYQLKYKGNPHGVSHLMGEQEHDGDPWRMYGHQPMKAGWLISNEPGLYGLFRLKVKGKVYEQEIGIRIEDNLLITDKGCRNMSQGIPKTVKEIEKIMAEKVKTFKY